MSSAFTMQYSVVFSGTDKFRIYITDYITGKVLSSVIISIV